MQARKLKGKKGCLKKEKENRSTFMKENRTKSNMTVSQGFFLSEGVKTVKASSIFIFTHAIVDKQKKIKPYYI